MSSTLSKPLFNRSPKLSKANYFVAWTFWSQAGLFCNLPSMALSMAFQRSVSSTMHGFNCKCLNRIWAKKNPKRQSIPIFFFCRRNWICLQNIFSQLRRALAIESSFVSTLQVSLRLSKHRAKLRGKLAFNGKIKTFQFTFKNFFFTFEISSIGRLEGEKIFFTARVWSTSTVVFVSFTLLARKFIDCLDFVWYFPVFLLYARGTETKLSLNFCIFCSFSDQKTLFDNFSRFSLVCRRLSQSSFLWRRLFFCYCFGSLLGNWLDDIIMSRTVRAQCGRDEKHTHEKQHKKKLSICFAKKAVFLDLFLSVRSRPEINQATTDGSGKQQATEWRTVVKILSAWKA